MNGSTQTYSENPFRQWEKVPFLCFAAPLYLSFWTGFEPVTLEFTDSVMTTVLAYTLNSSSTATVFAVSSSTAGSKRKASKDKKSEESGSDSEDGAGTSKKKVDEKKKRKVAKDNSGDESSESETKGPTEDDPGY